ncbi:hypothetical protein GGP41_007840 [Bipolaris sorokiniana]|uniref:Major facilitator superfamily (MFS) profile domain-containing protein n=1 Tax=Cochliobolus sativus TaxID=45130 RepID=A0A8H5ZP27_COCSA|nr:hypothetical protein GGP41_007840 [Bipolaris sorokiniana]
MAAPTAMLQASLLSFIFLVAIDATSIVLAVSTIAVDLGGNATESFWVGASYLLSMCLAQPIVAQLTYMFWLKSLVLASIVMLGVGSLLCEGANGLPLLLTGRTVQGLGAGGLTVLSYSVYGNKNEPSEPEHSIFLSLLAPTNAPNTKSPITRISDLEFVGILLFIVSVAPLLVGLSFAGSLYRWDEWQVIVPIASGGKPLIGLKLLKGQGIITFGGAFVLGLLMYALLLFLPIYYRAIKGKSAIATAIFLLPQTLMMAPCAGVVLVLVRLLRLHYSYTILLGWFCTAIGMGLLALLGAETSAVSDVLLNLLSGFGIGILLPALAYSAQEGKAQEDEMQKDKIQEDKVREATMVFIFMRYLGSALGLVVIGLIFQRVLRSNLGSTKFKSEADNMSKYATTLMYSIREISNLEDKRILIQVTEKSLRTVWLSLSLLSIAMFLLSCGTFVAGREEQRWRGQMRKSSIESVPQHRKIEISSGLGLESLEKRT